MLDQIIKIWNSKSLHQQVAEIYVLEHLSLWQRLNSFVLIQSYLVEHGHVDVVSKNIISIIDNDKILLEPQV